METNLDIKQRLRSNSVLVVVPSYNNPLTLGSVVEQVREYSDDILVVNDGSTDEQTAQIIDSLGVENISYSPNKGKGYAIRQAFKYARQNGFKYVITMDSDGQHFASDIVSFVEKIEESPESLIIGARNLRADNMPSKNTFANRFSNFWYRAETWQKLDDTQSGYRLYPVERLAGKRYFSNRYEFEVEVIVRAAWSGINVCNIPIGVYYPPEGQRVSHFKPLRDFFRISVVNSVLFILALLYYFPMKFFRACRPKNLVRLIKENVLQTKDSNHKIALAIGLGLFFGIFPIWGYQMLVAAAIAHLLKVSKTITLISSNISIPPMIPFILYGSYWVGGIVTNSHRTIDITNITIENVSSDIVQYLIGATVFAVICGVIGYLVSYLILLIFRKSKADV